jgi:hypothetical protein
VAIFEFGRARLYSADFGSLLTDHHSFRVTFSNTHTPYVDFFFECKAMLDDNDFFDYGQDCRITFFSDRRHGADRPSDRDTVDVHPHMGEVFVDMMIACALSSLRAEYHQQRTAGLP